MLPFYVLDKHLEMKIIISLNYIKQSLKIYNIQYFLFFMHIVLEPKSIIEIKWPNKRSICLENYI